MSAETIPQPEYPDEDISDYQVFMDAHSPSSALEIEAYYEAQDEKRLDSQPVWIVRNFYAGQGRVYDFYMGNGTSSPVGYIEDDGTCFVTAWMLPIGGQGEPEKVFDGPGDNFAAEFVAAKALIEYLAESEK